MDETQLTFDEQVVDYLKYLQQIKPNSVLKYSLGGLVLFEHNTNKK